MDYASKQAWYRRAEIPKYIPHNVMTARATYEEISGAPHNSLNACPHFVQEEISKAYELRVFVAGSFIQAFRIDSQSLKSSELDWRRGIDLLSFDPVETSDELAGKIRAFMRDSELIFGSIDLIVDQSDSVWFLECNEDGAWAWLDDRVGGALADAITSELVSQARG